MGGIVLRKLIKIILICLISLVFVLFASVSYLSMFRIFDASAQEKHMKELETMYHENYQTIHDSSFINYDFDNNDYKLNEVQYLATHNSYKGYGSALGRFFVGLGDSIDEAKAMRYSYHSLTGQLQNGIRSFELDLRYRGNDFELTHVPLVDARTNALKFDLALEEIRLYSDNNPEHLPIIVLMEIKDDWMILDPFLNEYNEGVFLKLDSLISDTFGDALFGPSDMIEENKPLKQTIQTSGWPYLDSLLGKVIFVMHPGKFVPMYYEMDTTLLTQSMFLGVDYNDLDKDYASFVVHNDPNIEAIQEMVDDGFIVRTRMDANLIQNEENQKNAVLSGAQMLTSDFTIGRSDLDASEAIYLDNVSTVIENQFLKNED